MFSSNRFRKY